MTKIYFFFILLLSIFPSYFASNFGGTSMALGILIFSTLVYLVGMKYFNSLFYMKKKFALLVVLFLGYTVITALFTNNFLNLKAYLSLFSLFFVFGSTYLVAHTFKYTSTQVLYKFIKYTFFIFMFFGIYHLIFIGGAHRPFPFSEASHYALFIGPFAVAFYVLTRRKIFKLLIILWLILAGIFFPNTTILMYALLIFLLHIKLSIKNIIWFTLGIIVFTNIIISTPYFYERIFFWNEQSSGNLTALVYLQGVQDAYYSFTSTTGFGIGFQQLGTQKPSKAGLLIQAIMGNERGLNRQDGGFTAAKIIAELGYLGIFFLVLYFIIFKKAFFYLSNYLYRKDYYVRTVIAYSFIYAFFIELFVRGAGYFTQGSFLFYVAISYLFIRKNNENTLNPQ
jgi:hypothetical protein